MSSKHKEPSELVASARHSFKQGYTKSLNNRLQQLKNLKRFFNENEEQIIQSVEQDLRRHHEETRLEIYVAIGHIEYVIDQLPSWINPEKPSKRIVDLFDNIYIYHEPYGVVLLMTSWNYPLLTLIPVVGAIAAGNCVVIKPSHNSPNTSKMLEKILPSYLDSDCYPIFNGDIEETNKLLQERFDYIYYTGSFRFGKTVHLAANNYLTPTTLELGGKNPVYIDNSANLEMAAARIMWGKCFNSGQVCIAPDYVLCSKNVESEFIKCVKVALRKFYGDNSKMFPIVNNIHFKRLETLLNGLNIAIGGSTDMLQNSIEITIAVDVDASHPIMQEEIFGPILPIITVNSSKEAVDYINSKEKPLSLYIFSENSHVTNYIIENTSSGGVTVNDTLTQLIVENLPFGGVGASGMGYYKGNDSFKTFTHRKSVVIKNSWRLMENINILRYPPYSRRKTETANIILSYWGGPSWKWWFSSIFIFILFIFCFIVGYTVYHGLL